MNEKELTVQIGRRFRAFRVTQGLSQKQVAAILAEITHSNISRLERGAIHRLSTAFLNNCRTKFGMSIDWLLTGDGPMILPDVESKVSQSKSSRQKGRKRRAGHAYVLGERSDLQRKLGQLATTLARATHLVQELFVHATVQGSRAGRK